MNCCSAFSFSLQWLVRLLFFPPFHCSTAISSSYSRRYEIFGQFLKRLSAKIFYMMMPAAVLITTTLLSTSRDTVEDILWEKSFFRILRLRIRLWMTQRPTYIYSSPDEGRRPEEGRRIKKHGNFETFAGGLKNNHLFVGGRSPPPKCTSRTAKNFQIFTGAYF